MVCRRAGEGLEGGNELTRGVGRGGVTDRVTGRRVRWEESLGKGKTTDTRPQTFN